MLSQLENATIWVPNHSRFPIQNIHLKENPFTITDDFVESVRTEKTGLL